MRRPELFRLGQTNEKAIIPQPVGANSFLDWAADHSSNVKLGLRQKPKDLGFSI
jgi:hypothetical protein